jgi:hypothetical protein
MQVLPLVADARAAAEKQIQEPPPLLPFDIRVPELNPQRALHILLHHPATAHAIYGSPTNRQEKPPKYKQI